VRASLSASPKLEAAGPDSNSHMCYIKQKQNLQDVESTHHEQQEVCTSEQPG